MGSVFLSVCRDNLGVALQAERVRRKAVKMEQFLASRTRLGPSTPSQLHGAAASASLRIPSGGLNHGSVRGIRCMCFSRAILTCGEDALAPTGQPVSRAPASVQDPMPTKLQRLRPG